MTEEEKKTIEYYRKKCSDWKKEKEGIEMTDLVIKLDEEYQRLDTMINLIEKQQKEIEEKTTIIMAGAEKVKQLEKEFITKQEIKENYIPKDKIINFIEKHKDNFYDGTANGCDYIDYEVIKEFIEEEQE